MSSPYAGHPLKGSPDEHEDLEAATVTIARHLRGTRACKTVSSPNPLQWRALLQGTAVPEPERRKRTGALMNGLRAS